MNPNPATEQPVSEYESTPEAQRAAEAFMVDLAVLCNKHRVSLFFGDRFADLWACGHRVGALADSEGVGGDRFELLSPDPLGPDAPEYPSMQVHLPTALVNKAADDGRWCYIGGVSSPEGYTAHLQSPDRQQFALKRIDRPKGLDPESEDAARFNESVTATVNQVVETLNARLAHNAAPTADAAGVPMERWYPEAPTFGVRTGMRHVFHANLDDPSHIREAHARRAVASVNLLADVPLDELVKLRTPDELVEALQASEGMKP